MEDKKPLITRDWLAIERTHLANERTFLAYFRTFLVILGTGVTILKIDLFSDLKFYGFILVGISTVVLAIGIYRLIKIKKNIKSYYNLEP